MAKRRRCQECRELKEDVKKRLDPFDAEVHGMESYMVMCSDCEHARAQEV